jgi:hypothetical protein
MSSDPGGLRARGHFGTENGGMIDGGGSGSTDGGSLLMVKLRKLPANILSIFPSEASPFY